MDKNMEHEMETGDIHGLYMGCWHESMLEAGFPYCSPVVETAVCHVCSRNVTLVELFFRFLNDCHPNGPQTS